MNSNLIALCYFLLLALNSSLAVQAQSVDDVVKVEFVTSTRGYQKKVVVTPREITVIEEGRQGANRWATPFNDKQWEVIATALKSVNIANIPKLESPTTRRYSDAARSSVLTIHFSGDDPVSHSFDNENPNRELLPLMDAITRLSATADEAKK